MKYGQLVVWPSNPDVRFIDLVSTENTLEPPHYDNYEEYYRPYTNLTENGYVIRYMHTSTVDPDTDGDDILDPDDWEPLSYSNDGFSPGCVDTNTNLDQGLIEELITENELKEIVIEKLDLIQTSCFDINIEIQTNIINSVSDFQTPGNNKKDVFLPDDDNDGI